MIADPIDWLVGGAQSDVLYRWATLLLVQGGFWFTAWLGYKGIKAKLEDAKQTAAIAAEGVKPISNGFAKGTKDSLAEIKELICEVRKDTRRIEDKVDTHIQDHARSSLKDKE